MWESAKKTDAAVLISQITGMKLGQTTPNFKRNPLPQCEVMTHFYLLCWVFVMCVIEVVSKFGPQALSFSLLYSDRSLDIICKDKREFEIWTSGIKVHVGGYPFQLTDCQV